MMTMPSDQAAIEAAINRVRVARAARRALDDAPGWEAGGATVTFPVSVAAPGSADGRNGHHWSWRTSHEPGSVFPAGTTPVHIEGRIGSVRFTGCFHVTVGEGAATAPGRKLDVTGVRGGPPAWLDGLPRDLTVPYLDPRRLRSALARRAAEEDQAVDEVLRSARPYLCYLVDELTPQLRHRQHTVEREDVISEGWKRAFQLLAQFAGPDRPPVAWSTALFRNCGRDMRRAVHALDGVSEMVVNLRAAVRAHPEVTGPEAMAAALAVEATERALASEQPTLSPEERHARAVAQPRACPVPIGQIKAAMSIPRIISWDDPVGQRDGAGGGPRRRLADILGGVEDPGVAAVEEPAGPTAAALGKLAGFSGSQVSDVLAGLGIDAGGDAAASELPRLRRQVLRPFILPGEAPQSEAVLRRAGQRARAKLFVDGELLDGKALFGAWSAGITAEEAARLDRSA